MSKGTNLDAAENDIASVDGDDLSTNQEAVVLPVCMGEVKLAVHWISPPYNQFTKVAPVERPGKK